MTTRSEGLTKTLNAEGTIPAYTLVKVGAADHGALAASAVSDFIIGVSGSVAAVANERVDVILGGIATVTYGATVARGALLTTDSSGRAVTAAPAAGTNNRIIGIAMISGVVGDLGAVLIDCGTTQG
jgi:hypothetical protein